VQLRARARRLGDHRVRRGGQPLRALDGYGDVLAPRGEDLLVQQRVARVARQRLPAQVVPAQGGQDADHHHVRADRARLVLRRVERHAHLVLVVGEAGTGEPARRHVDLDVELAELGLEVRVGDRRQRLGVAHGRIGDLVDEVELDLQPG
jgi:hypothetical protein